MGSIFIVQMIYIVGTKYTCTNMINNLKHIILFCYIDKWGKVSVKPFIVGNLSGNGYSEIDTMQVVI